MNDYDILRGLVESAAADICKACNGNRQARIRARKAMQSIKRQAVVVRNELMRGHSRVDKAAKA